MWSVWSNECVWSSVHFVCVCIRFLHVTSQYGHREDQWKRKEMIMIRADTFIELMRHRDDLEVNFKITIRYIRYKASNFSHVSYMI